MGERGNLQFAWEMVKSNVYVHKRCGCEEKCPWWWKVSLKKRTSFRRRCHWDGINCSCIKDGVVKKCWCSSARLPGWCPCIHCTKDIEARKRCQDKKKMLKWGKDVKMKKYWGGKKWGGEKKMLRTKNMLWSDRGIEVRKTLQGKKWCRGDAKNYRLSR